MSLMLSNDQKEVLLTIIDWYKKQSRAYITLGGYAGTGKTTLLTQFRRMLYKAKPQVKVAFCAYTGKAARVLEATLQFNKVVINKDSVSTIHSLIYAPVTNKGGQISGWKKKSKIYADLILLDEASMVDEELWQDLLSFEIPILAVGDHGQLPPINGSFSLMKQPDLRLERIHRQAEGNPIIKLSMMARLDGMIPVGDYGQGVRKISRFDSYAGQEVEEILRSYSLEWLILTGYNHTRTKLNQQIRAYQEKTSEDPQVGDTVICLKNNWDKGIYNGMQGTLKALTPVRDKRDDQLHWYEVEVALDDGSQYLGKISAHQFNQPSALQEFEGLNYKSLGDLFDFGYALTVHKAQGSQSPNVLLFEERNKHMSDEDWKRWLYTGITRAQERLVIVGN